MAELINISFQGDTGFIDGRLDDVVDMITARRLLRDAVDDMADAVEAEAKRQAPVETGALKLHPVDREDTRIGITEARFDVGFGQPTGIPSFGGGFSVRGPKGRFIKPSLYRPAMFSPGNIVARSVLTVPDEPAHAIWVHNGTGIYGPRKKIITAKVPGQRMKFPRWSKAIDRRPQWRLESVKGQKPQPYLENAFLLVDNTLIQARIELLRVQIAAET